MRKSYNTLLLLLLLLLTAPTAVLHAQSTLEERSRSVILVKNMQGLVPLSLSPSERITLLSDDLQAVKPLTQRLGSYLPADRISVRSLTRVPSLTADDLLVVVVTKGDRPLPGEVDSLLSERKSVLLFVDRPSADAYTHAVIAADAIALSAKGTEGMSALADALMGGIPFGGTLLDDKPTLFPNGAGLTTTKTRLATALPEDVDLDGRVLARIDRIAEEGLRAGAYPGCQVLVAKDGYVVYSKAFGYKDARRKESNSTETLYDLASMTKAMATVPLVMMADDEGRLRLSDRIDKHIDYLRWSNKGDVRISQLLQHCGGMPAVIRFYEEMIDDASYDPPLIAFRRTEGYPTQMDRNAWARSGFRYRSSMVSRDSTAVYSQRFCKGLYLSPEVREMMRREMKECNRRSGGYRYSDIDFLLLQEVLEHSYRRGLDTLFSERIAAPLGLSRLCYRPLRYFGPKEMAEGQRDDFLRHQTLRGDVDDEAAAMLGGVSGNAGLFGNAESCAVVCQMLLDGGRYGGRTLIDVETIRHYTTYRHRPSPYALGFDRQRGDGRGNTCEEAPMSTYGHTGFTGTCFWIDPTNQIVYIFLSNRVAPQRWNRKLSSLDIRTRIQSVIYDALP